MCFTNILFWDVCNKQVIIMVFPEKNCPVFPNPNIQCFTMLMVQFHHDIMSFPFYCVDLNWQNAMMFSI